MKTITQVLPKKTADWLEKKNPTFTFKNGTHKSPLWWPEGTCANTREFMTRQFTIRVSGLQHVEEATWANLHIRCKNIICQNNRYFFVLFFYVRITDVRRAVLQRQRLAGQTNTEIKRQIGKIHSLQENNLQHIFRM